MDPVANVGTRNNGSPTLRFEDDSSRMTKPRCAGGKCGDPGIKAIKANAAKMLAFS